MTTESPRTILIIDNDPGVLRALEARLESLGYCCVTAGSGAQGISEFSAQEIDLVISDLNMPQGDGVTVAKTIRRDSLVPIIFVSGFKSDYKEQIRGIQNVTVLQKPFSTETLIELVEAELALATVTQA